MALPFNLGFLVYLPGTWVIGELDIIRLYMVYDSTLLARTSPRNGFLMAGIFALEVPAFPGVRDIGGEKWSQSFRHRK